MNLFNLHFETILLSIPGIIITIGLHEWTKAVTAYKLGDTSVKTAGRLTPNPVKHMDMLGFLLKALMGYGWSKPIKLNPFSYKDRKVALITIFTIPFLVNILIGIFFAIASTMWLNHTLGSLAFSDINYYIWLALRLAAIANISFALLNFIPIYPLNGSFLLNAVAPRLSLKIASVEKIMQIVLIFFIVIGGASRTFGWLTHQLLGVFMIY